MLHLLIGVFDVLKTIVKDSVNFETFFKINLVIFLYKIASFYRNHKGEDSISHLSRRDDRKKSYKIQLISCETVINKKPAKTIVQN